MNAIAAVRRRLAGDFTVDEWGFDPELVSLLSPLMRLRWSLDVSGAANLPTHGPALLAFNRRFGSSEPFVVARAVRLETGRPLRVAGVPDVMIAGPLLRRLGGVLDGPDEIAAVLGAGHLVGVALSRSLIPRVPAGDLDAATVAEARRLGVPVHPVALIGRERQRRWRVVIGEAMHAAGTEAVRDEIAAMIGKPAPRSGSGFTTQVAG